MSSTTLPCATPWNELRLGTDLIASAFQRGDETATVGNDEPVLVLPGFGTTDSAMRLLHRHLRDRGFRTYRWQLGVNLGPSVPVMRALARRVRTLARRHGRPVHLVGWSMGGILARAVAGRCRREVGRVVSLGSPLSGDPACSWLSSVVSRCMRSLNPRWVRKLLAQSASVPVTSIYSRRDGVVHWHASVHASGKVDPIEVDATHLGLVVDRKVFDKVVAALQ